MESKFKNALYSGLYCQFFTKGCCSGVTPSYMEHPPVPPQPPSQMDLQYLSQMQPMAQPGYSQYGYQDPAQLQMPCGDSCSTACAPACSEGRYILGILLLFLC